MRIGIGNSGYKLPAMVALSLLVVTVTAIVLASVNSPGPTGFLELDENVGFDAVTPDARFDWANSGASAIPRDCPETVDPGTGYITKNCDGTGGVFDGGVFRDATHPPTPPSVTAAALADPHIVAATFEVDELSIDHALVNNPPDDPTAPVVDCGIGDPTVFTSVGGEVNGDDLNSETFSTGSVPNKDEISNVYAIAHEDPLNPPTAGNDDTYEIFAGFERVVNNGDSHVDLEFLQQPVFLVPGSKPAAFPCAGRFQGHRTQGDLLLSVDFTRGGEVGNPSIHRWVCGDFPPSPDGICDPVKNPGRKIPPHYEAVSDSLTLNAVRQKFNGTGPIGCGGWGCRNADGTQTDTINTVEFYEVGIDLAALGFRGCLSTFLPHTRSSQSFTATLKDFAVIPFNTCVPSTVLTKTVDKPEITIGDSVTYTYKELNDGNVPLTNPYVTDDKCSPVTYQSGDTNSNGVLDTGEEWRFTCTLANVQQDVTNTAIGHGTFTILGQAKDVTYCADPTAPPPLTVCDQDEKAQASVKVLVPSTNLNKSASASVVTTITYTYAETNDGKVPLSPPVQGVLSSFVEDDTCGSVVYVGGDANGNGKLDPGETFNFTCQTIINGAGSVTNIAKGHGIDNLNRDVTVCPSPYTSACFNDTDEKDTNTVTVSVSVNQGK